MLAEMNITDLTRATIASPSDLMTWASHLESLNKTQGPMLFRGQAEEYINLLPTLARSTQGGAHDAATLLERRLIKSFRTHYQELDALPQNMPTPGAVAQKSDVEILSLMQHYEVPSRVLDWSESVWIATYFACASSPTKDAELWFFDSTLLDHTPIGLPAAAAQEKLAASIGGMPGEYHPELGMPLLALVDPLSNARLVAQQGRLTASDNATVDHAGLMWHLATRRQGREHPGNFFGRYVIKKERKRDILQFLAEEREISAKTLFPDIVGLGRFLRWEFEALRTAIY